MNSKQMCFSYLGGQATWRTELADIANPVGSVAPSTSSSSSSIVLTSPLPMSAAQMLADFAASCERARVHEALLALHSEVI